MLVKVAFEEFEALPLIALRLLEEPVLEPVFGTVEVIREEVPE